MKKLFLMGLAATAVLASCSNDETVEMNQSKAIGFSNTFVNNSTRTGVDGDPSLTASTLGSFAVYGYMGTTEIFNGTEVSSEDEGETWTYSPLQYWFATNTYTFGAIAPYSVAKYVIPSFTSGNEKVGMAVNFTNDGKTDLLHADPPGAITCDENFLSNPSKVAMTFNHQLSKVKFSFENAISDAYTVKVAGVKITNAYKTGTLTVANNNADNSWSDLDNNILELDFGNAVDNDATSKDAAAIPNGSAYESYYERLMIPSENTAEYNVTFTVTLFNASDGTTAIGTYEHKTTIKNVELQLGYCYNFKATLEYSNVDPDGSLKPIEFAVAEVKEWNEWNE